RRPSAAIRLFAPQAANTAALRHAGSSSAGVLSVAACRFHQSQFAVAAADLAYRRIIARIVKDPAARTHLDEALRPHTSPGETDHFVEVFADKIPHTHGAPVRPAAVVVAQ